MSNLALNKPIIEGDKIQHANRAVDGNTKDYSRTSGYCYFFWPGYLTVDLESKCEVRDIRLLLYDKDDRKHKYRLLTSVDMKNWTVHYDGADSPGQSGWQVFQSELSINVRYIRVHGLYHDLHEKFCLVQLEAYKPMEPKPECGCKFEGKLHGCTDNVEIDANSSLPASKELDSLMDEISSTLENTPGIDKTYFMSAFSKIRDYIRDLSAIAGSSEAIYRQIIDPVNKELTKGKKLNIRIGIAGLLLAIVSILVTIFDRILRS